jgi:signal transduction histidine kinase
MEVDVSGGLARRMGIASGLLTLMVGTAFAVLLVSVIDLRASERLARHSEEVLATANQLERLIVDLETGQRGFVITGQEHFLEPWQAARIAVPDQVGTLERLVADDPVQQSRVGQIAQAATSYILDYSVPLVDAARRDPASARTVAATEAGKRRVDAMRAEFDRLVAAERRLSVARQERSDAAARWAIIAAVAGFAGSVLLIGLFTGYMTRTIVRPVLGAAAMASRLADGDLATRMPETGVGEIGTLERAFNSMASSLESSRAELAASRARIVKSADETRRRIERDLHDGIQQRLVSLALDLRVIQGAVPAELLELRTQLGRVVDELVGALDDLREISRGIHPAILSEGGLGPALKVLARRCSIPVEVDLKIEKRLPEPVEVAAYYVASEALTNTAKHAHASIAQINVQSRDDRLHLLVRDDGVGGADPARGSGLIGLTDRVQALGGTITVHSPLGEGTTLQAVLPISLEND